MTHLHILSRAALLTLVPVSMKLPWSLWVKLRESHHIKVQQNAKWYAFMEHIIQKFQIRSESSILCVFIPYQSSRHKNRDTIKTTGWINVLLCGISQTRSFVLYSSYNTKPGDNGISNKAVNIAFAYHLHKRAVYGNNENKNHKHTLLKIDMERV